MTTVIAALLAAAVLTLTGNLIAALRGWVRPAGAPNNRRQDLLTGVLIGAAIVLAAAGALHHSWLVSGWAAAIAALTTLSQRSHRRRRSRSATVHESPQATAAGDTP